MLMMLGSKGLLPPTDATDCSVASVNKGFPEKLQVRQDML